MQKQLSFLLASYDLIDGKKPGWDSKDVFSFDVMLNVHHGLSQCLLERRRQFQSFQPNGHVSLILKIMYRVQEYKSQIHFNLMGFIEPGMHVHV